MWVPCRADALRKVKVPMDVIDLLAELRTFLQEKCEPPVYVSDRRLVKALNLLQVRWAAFIPPQEPCSR